MASQQAPARPRFLIASLPAPAPARPSNQVPQPTPSFMTRPTTFGQNFRLPIATQPPPSAAVAPPPLPATAAPPAAAPRAAVVPVISSSSSSVPPPFQPRIFSTPKSPLPNSHVPKLVSPSPTPSPFQASLAVSINAPTTITTAPPTTPNSFPKINKSHPNNAPSQSAKASPISQPPSPPCEISKKHYSDSKNSGVKVITLAGDNEGATTVKLSSSRKKGDSVEITDEEGNSNQNPRVGFVINSNEQGVNNSIIYNSSLTHSSGVRLPVYRKANGATNE